MSDNKFKIESPFEPSGDQPEAIRDLCEGIERGEKNQVLLGVTGSVEYAAKYDEQANLLRRVERLEQQNELN